MKSTLLLSMVISFHKSTSIIWDFAFIPFFIALFPIHSPKMKILKITSKNFRGPATTSHLAMTMASNKHKFYVSCPYIDDLLCKKSRKSSDVFDKNCLHSTNFYSECQARNFLRTPIILAYVGFPTLFTIFCTKRKYRK